MCFSKAAVILTLVILPVAAVNAQDTAGEIAELRQLVSEMRTDYETRISALEARLVAAERAVRSTRVRVLPHPIPTTRRSAPF